MSLKVELPEIIDDKHPIAHLITALDKEGNVLNRIQSLNTKTLEAKAYIPVNKDKTSDFGSLKIAYKVKLDKQGNPELETIQLEDITIKVK